MTGPAKKPVRRIEMACIDAAAFAAGLEFIEADRDRRTLDVLVGVNRVLDGIEEETTPDRGDV